MANPGPKIDFESWSLDNLVEFARQANEKLREQQELMDELRADCRAALKAYRESVKKASNDT